MSADEHIAAYQAAEDQLVALQAEKDEKLDAIWAEYRPKLVEARDEAARLQKLALDAQVLDDLAGRDDIDSASLLAQAVGLVDSHEAFLEATQPAD